MSHVPRPERRATVPEPSLAPGDPRDNRLLAALPDESFARLEPHLTRRPLAQRQLLWRADDAVREVVFPVAGALSCVIQESRPRTVEVALIGREGVAPFPLRGGQTVPTGVVVQLGGEGFALPVTVLEAEIEREPRVGRLLQRYALARYGEAARSILCISHHRVHQRLARWFLECHDRVGVPAFGLTQDFMGQMLAVGRGSVNAACSALEKAGVVECRPGLVAVQDRPRLEELSCACYMVIRAQFERVHQES